jgi:hypothetical protein
MLRRSRINELSEQTHDAIACLQAILFCWLALFLLALGVFVTFVGNVCEEFYSGLSIFVMIWTGFIIAINAMLIAGMKHRITTCWYAAVLFLLLHLMGLLALFALFGLVKIFKLEVQADYGLARSPRDPLPVV